MGKAPSAEGSRQRVVWHLLAFEYALSISAMRCHFERHLVKYDTTYDGSFGIVRVGGGCGGCDFPGVNADFFRNEDDYEAYVCISCGSDGGVITEGFRAHEADVCGLAFEYNRENFDFGTWPELLEINKIFESIDDGAEDAATYEAAERFERHLSDHMEDLTVVVVAIHKETDAVSLLAAQSNFGDRQRGSGDSAIDNMGDHEFCWPHGYMASKSHGVFNKDTDSIVKLGLLFNTARSWATGGEVVRKECVWTVQISLD